MAVKSLFIYEDFDYDNEPSIVIDIPLDEKFIGNEGYDPDKMLGINSSTSSIKKSVKNAFVRKNEDPEENKRPQKTITEIKVSHITKEDIEKKRNSTAQIELSGKTSEEKNKEEVRQPVQRKKQVQNPKQKSKPKLAEMVKEVNVEDYLSSSAAINDAEEL